MGQPQVVAVIPARYASQRLPAKMLLHETGRPLLQHVYERVASARRIGRVVVATDDERIREAVRGFGGEAVLTSPDRRNGTERVAEAARSIPGDVFLNIQGDEPEVPPEAVDALAELAVRPETPMATLACPLRDLQGLANPNQVKIVIGADGFALYFSRSPVPYTGPLGVPAAPLLHVGAYAYARKTLERYALLEPTPIERSERLEQLRAMEHGIRIRAAVLDLPAWGGIDTPEDYRAFVERFRSSERQAAGAALRH